MRGDVAFPRLARSLAGGSPAAAVLAAAGAILMVAWAAWFVGSAIPDYEVSRGARLEAARGPHVVASVIRGRVVSERLELGRVVRAGESLVELDTRDEALALAQVTARIGAIASQLAATRAERDAEVRVVAQLGTARVARKREAEARRGAAQATALRAARDARRSAQLREQEAVSDADHARVLADATNRREELAAAAHAIGALESEARAAEERARARIAALEYDIAELEGERETLDARSRLLALHIENGVVRAPLDGRLGEVARLRAGSFVGEGERVAVIVPSGDLRVVAEFPPEAMGRIAPGQPARVRLDAFPWTEYGTVPARVVRVGSASNDEVQVELSLDPASNARIALQHGLVGSVEVETSRDSPAAIAMRSLGRLAHTRAAP